MKSASRESRKVKRYRKSRAPMKIRINKYLAQSGFGSRRKVEDLISAGRIRLNGLVVEDFATQVDPETDMVSLDGKQVAHNEEKYYLIMNKPKGYITTLSDEKGRPIVMNLVPEKYKRAGVFPIGRLDKDTEGLLLLTNDGDLANRLTSPRSHITKVYMLELDKPLVDRDQGKIEKGIFLHQLSIKTRPSLIEKIEPTGKRITITIIEGKKRQIRYTFKNFGYKVLKLRRVAYGPLTLEGINKGDVRALKAKEIRELKNFIPESAERIRKR
jgi:23S rRNA pseudouridine2605 synthase